MKLFAELKLLVAAATVLTALPVLAAGAMCLPDRLSAAADLGRTAVYFSSVSL